MSAEGHKCFKAHKLNCVDNWYDSFYIGHTYQLLPCTYSWGPCGPTTAVAIYIDGNGFAPTNGNCYNQPCCEKQIIVTEVDMSYCIA